MRLFSMRKAEQPNESTEEKRERSAFRHYMINELIFTFGVLATLVIPVLVFLITSSRPVVSKLSVPLIVPVLLELIAVVFVRVADLMGRKNRDVIHLQKELARIYLSALRKSALNPKLESLTSHN
jgi:hypothetical protein